MSLSKAKSSSGIPIAIDTGDGKLIYYGTTGSQRLEAVGLFKPFFWGDSVVYVSGRRGSGKSYYCNDYIKYYVEATGNKVFLISRFDEDPSINLPERAMRIPITDLPEIEVSDLHHSLIVFDDIESASLTKKEKTLLNAFIVDTIENSRKSQISTVITSHLTSNYAKTRSVLYESSSLVFFPDFSNKVQIERALNYYLGISQEIVQKVLSITNSRWVQVNVIKPKFILTEKEIFTY